MFNLKSQPLLISVIIPTYKPKAYLWECLDSIANQTISTQNYEVIIVLNGCTEPWAGELEKYISSNMSGLNVNFVNCEEGGVSNARNIALNLAKGEYITFIDDDDYVSSNYLEDLLEIASPTIVSCSNTFSFNDGCTELLKNEMTNEYYTNCGKGLRTVNQVKKFFSGPVYKLIHKSIIGQTRFNLKFKNGEDSLFMFQISKNIKNVSMAGADCVYYRRLRINSATSTKKTLKYRFLLLCKALREYCIIYFKAPFEYNLIFFGSRILGAVKTFFFPN